MMPASNGWRREVVFLWRNTIFILLYFPTRFSGCTVALSRNNKTFRFSSIIMQLSFSSIFSVISISIHDFPSAKLETCFDAAFVLFKQQGFFAFPNDYCLIDFTTIGTNKKATVILCFDVFPPLRFSFFVQGLWKKVPWKNGTFASDRYSGFGIRFRYSVFTAFPDLKDFQDI